MISLTIVGTDHAIIILVKDIIICAEESLFVHGPFVGINHPLNFAKQMIVGNQRIQTGYFYIASHICDSFQYENDLVLCNLTAFTENSKQVFTKSYYIKGT